MNQIKNVVAQLDETGKITSLSFTGSVTNKQGVEFTEDVTYSGTFPDPVNGKDENGNLLPYLSVELSQFAAEHAQEIGLMPRLNDRANGVVPPVDPGTPSDVPPPESVTLTDEQQKKVWMDDVDTQVANVTNNFTRFQMEYEAREKAAQDFKDANYQGDATIWVTAFAQAANLTDRQATDLILQQSVQLRSAVQNLGAARMAKYKILNAETMEAAKTEYETILATIATIRANLP